MMMYHLFSSSCSRKVRSLFGSANSQLKESTSLQKASVISALVAVSGSIEDRRLFSSVTLGEAEMLEEEFFARTSGRAFSSIFSS